MLCLQVVLEEKPAWLTNLPQARKQPVLFFLKARNKVSVTSHPNCTQSKSLTAQNKHDQNRIHHDQQSKHSRTENSQDHFTALVNPPEIGKVFISS